MNTIKAFCPNCGLIERTVAQQIGGRLVFAGAGAALGTTALKNPWIALALTIAGYTLGVYLEEQVSKRCPQCGALLQITGLLP